jgi:AraC-like DNA-binding protein
MPHPYFVGHYGSGNQAWKSNSDFVIPGMGYAACCLAGKGIVHVGSEERPWERGMAYLCRWDDPKAWHRAASAPSEELRWVFMVFMGEAALAMLDDMLAHYGSFYRLDPLSSLVYRLMTVSRQPAHDTGIAASDAASMVWDLLRALLHSAEQDHSLATRVDLAESAARVIQERDIGRLSVTTVAALLDVSREHLARVFAARYGQSLSSYLARVRMQLACELLRDTDTPVKEIAATLGYATLPAFHRAFRQQTGATPGAYRRGRLGSALSHQHSRPLDGV